MEHKSTRRGLEYILIKACVKKWQSNSLQEENLQEVNKPQLTENVLMGSSPELVPGIPTSTARIAGMVHQELIMGR